MRHFVRQAGTPDPLPQWFLVVTAAGAIAVLLALALGLSSCTAAVLGDARDVCATLYAEIATTNARCPDVEPFPVRTCNGAVLYSSGDHDDLATCTEWLRTVTCEDLAAGDVGPDACAISFTRVGL